MARQRQTWSALLLICAVLAACAPASTPTLSSSPSVRTTVLVRVDHCAKVCVDSRRIQYWSDGMVIRLSADGRQFERRQLTASGADRVLRRLQQDVDLLAGEFWADPVLLPGRERPPYTGIDTYSFYRPAVDGGLIRTASVNAATLDLSTWASTPQMDRLSALGLALLDPEALAGDGWSDPSWTAYDPPARMVFVATRPSAAPFSTPDIGAANVPLGRDLLSFGIEAVSPLNAWQYTRCALLDRTEADQLLAGLPTSAFPLADRLVPLQRVMLGDATRDRELMVMVLIPLPDELTRTCSDPWLGYVW